MTAAARGAGGPALPRVTIKITLIINLQLNFKIEFKIHLITVSVFRHYVCSSTNFIVVF